MYRNTQRYLSSPDQGLSSRQVRERQEQGLFNTQPDGMTKTTAQIIRENVFTWFNAFNIGVGLCLAAVGAYKNLFYLGVVFLNTLIGIVQEIRSKRTVERLSLISAPHACVVRDGALTEIAVNEIVLDDVMLLKLGNQVCADAVIVAGEAEVDESLLTGEAEPVRKSVGDRLYSGSFIVSGSCRARAEHIGADNYASKIAAEAKKHKKVQSALMKSLDKVVKFTSLFVLPLGLLLFLSAYFLLQRDMQASVVSAAGAILGMMPKGLVLLTSVSLAVGVVKLASKKTLVQELFCIETLSRVDTLCLDKTGTITEGKMAVTEVIVIEEGVLPASIEDTMSSFAAAQEDENATFAALKKRFSAPRSLSACGKTPFSSARKWSSVTFVKSGTVVLGAPEILMKRQRFSLPPKALQAQREGGRVLLAAWTPEPVAGSLPQRLYPAAAIVLRDPVRKDAKETLAFFREQDVDLKIISGDSPVTVSGIARQASLEHYDSYVDASLLGEAELEQAAERYTIFGRVSPEQKRLLVHALQSKGHTVAMTGDGVNDVLALKDADCSIAMASGSDAARQVSQLVLLESNFSALPSVVMEGRRVVNNITRTASLFLVKTIFSFLLAFASLLFGMSYPLEPIQLTLIGIFAEGIPSFVLALEPNRERVRDDFLRTVLERAFPTAIIIMLYLVIVGQLTPLLGMEQVEAATLSVYLAGFAWLVQLFDVCRPFNRLRAVLWAMMTAGFFLSAYFLQELFSLGTLTWQGILTFVLLAAFCYPVQLLLERVIRGWYCFWDKKKTAGR